VEGERKLRTNYVVERNPKLRAMAVQIHGRDCCACQFNFDKTFGAELARGYIEVHHLKPIAGGERTADPATDLVPLCGNCHSHQRTCGKGCQAETTPAGGSPK